MQIDPRPPILGFVPSMYDERRAIHKTYLQQLPAIANELQIKTYPKVRDSSEFKNASANGLPLQKYRPAASRQIDRTFVPSAEARLAQANFTIWQRAVERAKHWVE